MDSEDGVKRTLGILNSGSLILYLEPAVIASFGNRQMFIPGVEGFRADAASLKLFQIFRREKTYSSTLENLIKLNIL